jgi:hypothetical protein
MTRENETVAERTARYDAMSGLGGSRRRPAPPVDHLDAVRDMATVAGLTQIHDSGPCLDGRLAIFADEIAAHDYLHGNSKRIAGVFVEVGFNRAGEIARASMRINRSPIADITGNTGSAGQRLLWTLQMFERLLEAPEVTL